MPKLTTIITAAALALTVSAGTIHDTDAKGNPDDVTTRVNGVEIQTEYEDFYRRHEGDPRLHVIEDDRSVIMILRPGVIMAHDYTVHVVPSQLTDRLSDN